MLDAVGAGNWRLGLRASRRGARIVRIVGDIPYWVHRFGLWPGTIVAYLLLAWFFVRCRLAGRKPAFVLRPPDGGALRDITALVEAGRLRPVVDRVYPLAEIAEAHRYQDSGRAKGKIGIAVRE